jgi:hypothetical protein
VKLREFLKKFRRRSPQDGEDKAAGNVNEAFSVSSEQAASTWIPSQQDRPRH